MGNEIPTTNTTTNTTTPSMVEEVWGLLLDEANLTPRPLLTARRRRILQDLIDKRLRGQRSLGYFKGLVSFMSAEYREDSSRCLPERAFANPETVDRLLISYEEHRAAVHSNRSRKQQEEARQETLRAAKQEADRVSAAIGALEPHERERLEKEARQMASEVHERWRDVVAREHLGNLMRSSMDLETRPVTQITPSGRIA